MDWSLQGSSVHEIPQERILEWVATPFSRGNFWTQGSNPGFLNSRQILYYLKYQGSHASTCMEKISIVSPKGITLLSAY